PRGSAHVRASILSRSAPSTAGGSSRSGFIVQIFRDAFHVLDVLPPHAVDATPKVRTRIQQTPRSSMPSGVYFNFNATGSRLAELGVGRSRRTNPAFDTLRTS